LCAGTPRTGSARLPELRTTAASAAPTAAATPASAASERPAAPLPPGDGRTGVYEIEVVDIRLVVSVVSVVL
jgi:hypothetical protein